jgi:ABC-type sugar transport system substrate-binding protein
VSTSTAFRILRTLEQRGLVLRVGERQYHLNIQPAKRRKYRIGFAGQTQEFSFSRSVAESIRAAAARADIDLLVLDNHYSSKAALRNADTFVRERVELAIEFQTDEHVAPVILRQSRARRVLIGAINDPSALGALRAMEEAGRAETCVAMGQNASLEARTELRQPSTRLIGSVAYFPELYGDALITLATEILQRKPVPPAVFVKHQMVTRENVDRLYPNDVLLSPGELETLLLKSR